MVDGAQMGAKTRVATPVKNYTQFCQTIVDLVHDDSSAIGISIAGIVDEAEGTVSAANIACLQGKNLRSDLSDILNIPVYLINDANAFGLAEALQGHGKGKKSVLALILGTGLGGALILNGQLHTGPSNTAGEWGHGPASLSDIEQAIPLRKCDCGQLNCLDLFGGARGLEFLYLNTTKENLDSIEILTKWEDGDQGAVQAVTQYLKIVGGSLAQIINFFDPSAVIAGGGLSANTALMSALSEEIQKRSLAGSKCPQIQQAVCGPDAGLLGAAFHVFSHQDKIS